MCPFKHALETRTSTETTFERARERARRRGARETEKGFSDRQVPLVGMRQSPVGVQEVGSLFAPGDSPESRARQAAFAVYSEGGL